LRFTLIKDLKKDKSMQAILSGLLTFMFLYLIVDIFVKQGSFGIFSDEITMTLFGNVDEFLDPMSKASFLEFIHTEIFFIMMILLTLSAVYLRVANNNKYSILLVNGMMMSALSSLIALGVSFYFASNLVLIYVVCFFIWHILASYMTLYSLWSLNFAKSI